MGIPDKTRGEVGHANIIRKPGSALTADEVIACYSGKLSRYKWLKKVTLVKEFTRTSLGVG